MAAVDAVRIVMQYTRRVGGRDAGLLCGDKKFQDILPIVFGGVHCFQRHGEKASLSLSVLIETVRQQDAAPALRDPGHTGDRTAHLLQRLLQGAEAVMDLQDLLLCQNLAVVEQLLQIDGILVHVIVQIF